MELLGQSVGMYAALADAARLLSKAVVPVDTLPTVPESSCYPASSLAPKAAWESLLGEPTQEQVTTSMAWAPRWSPRSECLLALLAHSETSMCSENEQLNKSF